ncbi:3'-5' exonuclease [Nitrincola tapanii]|uniref:Exonuclease domain-containing protein n=1 Tax=Nitrincola tapanii TaxID=1708751 RepID=A0A5A9W2F2_9GAMM|nr:3'-5' exonuclease [Nitrincola tapanii]KAA0874782.1 exonuclease domain-containing protein [Nitrincola tapanii]
MQQAILIVDLEATCWENQIAPSGSRQSVHEMEIIELGCVVATCAGVILESRSFLVRPQINPILSPFCQQLTSIKQMMVDQAPVFAEVVPEVDAWLRSWPDLRLWASWGNYDRRHIAAQSAREDCMPTFMRLPHLNLKSLWKMTTGERKHNGLGAALKFHALTFEGQPHRGIDDARNMARLLPQMDWSLAIMARTDGVEK